MSTVLRLFTLLLPLLLTPLWGYLLAENHLSLGGGEKDIVVLLPWLAWSLLFLGFGAGFWKTRLLFRPWLLQTGMASLGVLALLWLTLLAYSLFTTR